MKKSALFLGVLLSHAALAHPLTDSQRDSLLETLSESIFIGVGLEKALSEEREKKYHYELTKGLFEKGATQEMNLREAAWKWKRAEAAVFCLKANLRIKEAGVKLKQTDTLTPKETETLMKERFQGRLDSARGELARAESDKEYFSYAHAIYEKLYEKQALTKQQLVEARIQLEGSLRELTHIQKSIVQMEKIILNQN